MIIATVLILSDHHRDPDDIRAHKHLTNLPEVVTDTVVARLCGFSKAVASVTLSRWKALGLVDSLGPKTGVYFILVANRHADKEFFSDAFLLTYPTGILHGESVLHAAGWTTQIPQQMSVAVLNRSSYQMVHGVRLTEKGTGWLILAHNFKAKDRVYGFRSVTPAFALADMILSSDGWKPDADDLYLDHSDWKKVSKAFEALKIEVPELYQTHVSQAIAMR